MPPADTSYGLPARKRGTKKWLACVGADKIWIRPKGKAPEGVISGAIIEVFGHDIQFDVANTQEDLWVKTTSETAWEATNIPKVAGGQLGQCILAVWLLWAAGRICPLSWGGHGILRMDFGTSWSVARGQPIISILESRREIPSP
jgi:hypothetical protein